MCGVGSVNGADPLFSHHRRTTVILSGEGTAAAYLAGVVGALNEAGLRIDCLVGRGAGALVAALSAIDSGSRLAGKQGLLAHMEARRPWRYRPLYLASFALIGACFAVFLSPVLFGAAALLTLPLVAMTRFLSERPAEGLVLPWLSDLVSAAEPFYLRALVVPLIALCALWVLWLTARIVTTWRRPDFPEPIDLSRLDRWLTESLWQAVRGASASELPSDRRALGDAYRKLLAGSLGQRGYAELIFYALDTDSGQEVPFVLLKDRYAKKLAASRAARGDRSAEPVDLAGEDSRLFFDALLASLSPPGWVPSVPIRLPLGSSHGGEVHRFASSLLAAGSAVSDAIAAGAEQVIFVSTSVPGESTSGSSPERVTEAAQRRDLSQQLHEASRVPDLSVFLIRPDRQRLGAYEVSGRAQRGGERLGLGALYAHGRRDAGRLFVEPVLGDGQAPEVESQAPAAAYQPDLPVGPHEF